MKEPIRNEYAVAGWLAIAAAVLIFPSFVLGIAIEVAKHRAPGLVLVLLVPYLLVTIAYTICGLYALLRFRILLNRRHAFHAIDGLVTAIVVGVIALTLYVLPVKVFGLSGAFDKAPLALLVVVPVAIIGVVLGILSIIVGFRLLRLPTDKTSYYKVYAWLSIAAGFCFVTFILGPLGGLIDAAGNLVLAMLFLKPEEEELAPEFV